VNPPAHAWAVFTVAAAGAQTARNAMQRGLTARVGVAAASWARFIFAPPFALLSLAVVLRFEAGAVALESGFAPWLVVGSVAQMAATATMLMAMRELAFVTVVAYTKTEPLQVAAFSLAFLADPLTPVRLGAVLIGTLAVMLLSWPRERGAAAQNWRSAAWGIAAGGLFAMAAVGYRGAILQVSGVSFLTAATFSLAATLTVQTLLSFAWLLTADRPALRGLFQNWRESVPAGLAGAVASQFWFLAFALHSPAAVRTLGLVEVVFAQLVSWRVFRERIGPREIAGLTLLGLAVVAILRA
jgi:drug/metabolite transporter (DMT)-like permease